MLTKSITDINELDLSKLYTYADYLTWQFKERVELIYGKVFKMSPAPDSIHQMVVGNLHFIFKGFLKGKKCIPFLSPFDVRLSENILSEKVTTVVQPDLSVICDMNKIDAKGCKGAPDLILEIVSAGNS